MLFSAQAEKDQRKYLLSVCRNVVTHRSPSLFKQIAVVISFIPLVYLQCVYKIGMRSEFITTSWTVLAGGAKLNVWHKKNGTIQQWCCVLIFRRMGALESISKMFYEIIIRSFTNAYCSDVTEMIKRCNNLHMSWQLSKIVVQMNH